MIKTNHATELSYFKGILFVTLEENYPEKVSYTEKSLHKNEK